MSNNYIARKLIILKQFESMLPSWGNIEGKNIRLYRRELTEISDNLKFDKSEFDIPYYEICKEEKIGFGVAPFRHDHFGKPKYREFCNREVFLMRLHRFINYLEEMLMTT
jgi:hypothetical protein